MKSQIKYLVLTCLLCLNFIEGAFRCDYKYSSETRTWFKFHKIPATWFDARLRCSLEGAVLASPTTPDIITEMRNIMNTSSPENEIFTGIHATFSQGDYYTVEGTSLSEIPVNWAKNEPNNKDNQESCITLNGDGDLADRSCEQTRSYICYHPEKNEIISECGTVDHEYYFDKRTNKCYKFHTVARNFSRAFMACSAEGGHLAIINSELEATVLRELFDKHPSNQIAGNFEKTFAFIGFHDWGEKHDFRTIQGQTLTEAGYSTFISGEPNNKPPGESCGSIRRSNNLNDLHCHPPAVFFCERSPENKCHAEDKH